MVLFNYTTREITAKIVYYGPGLGGKTTNLQSIYDDLPAEMKGKMLSLATKSDRTLFFDFLPIDLGSIGGMKVRVQLYTVPGQVYYNSTRKLVLKGADGVVFVADSQTAMAEANRESLDNLYKNLDEQNVKIDDISLALQYNKRDLSSVMPVEKMNEHLNRGQWPVFEAVGTQGIGVQETLREMLKLVVLSLKEKYDFSVGESALLEELNQAGEALKGSTPSAEQPSVDVAQTPPVESAISSPPPAVVQHDPVHTLSAASETLETGGEALDEEPGGDFDTDVVPEMELFELDDEFLDSGDDDEGSFAGSIEDPYGDESVLVIDEDEAESLPEPSAGSDALVSPTPSVPVELEAGETEVTVPLSIRLDHQGVPLDLKFTLTLRLEGTSSGVTGNVTIPDLDGQKSDPDQEG